MMLLGVFHFHDSGRDWYKPQVGFDVFSEKRQREIAEVVERLVAYRPTKIAIEATPTHQEEINGDYGAYLRDEFELRANESHQLGFRLARYLAHDKVYCVDARDRHYAPNVDLDAYAREHGQEHLLSEWSPRFKKLYEHGDRLKTQLTLREIFLQGNSEERILRSHGHYLVDWFKLGKDDDYTGPDWVTGWYNRNLRIFANLQRITTLADERILLIIGAGHLPILRHCPLASPEYELVEVFDYLELRDSGEGH